jgi:hypothetical protein
LLLVRHKDWLFLWRCCPRLQAEFGHKPSPALHGVRHTGRVGFVLTKKFETGKTKSCDWCFWPVLLHKTVRSRPNCLRGDLTVIFFPTFRCLPSCHSADSLSGPVNCRFRRWIPGFTPQLSQPLFKLQTSI